MRPVDCVVEYSYPNCDYDELVASFEIEVLLEVHDNDYSGDSRYLLRDGDRYGLLFFGWGSCSGCDSLQACTTVEDVTALRDDLWNDVHWEPDLASMARYVHDKDWSLDYSWHADETKQFIERAKQMLSVDGTPYVPITPS